MLENEPHTVTVKRCTKTNLTQPRLKDARTNLDRVFDRGEYFLLVEALGRL